MVLYITLLVLNIHTYDMEKVIVVYIYNENLKILTDILTTAT